MAKLTHHVKKMMRKLGLAMVFTGIRHFRH
jgi:AICAR transformylase/IMP cyclohydrolase PurH